MILRYEEFVAIQQALVDADDLAALRDAKKNEHDAPTIPLDQVVKELAKS